eukprot:CAMPEP_0115485804 /NCGR_PEP_ID=MMETSP0271-20121206/60109_1 /TAXON_ID=71861 /ORGANISM="Scrippsiella trochoidea, Strain CCMP3099" /LENGTH=145 /DNA_ID=CAMNT_0002913795 /DNA_START=149 /DNA_END=584 /DNA_ORIENTATION=+
MPAATIKVSMLGVLLSDQLAPTLESSKWMCGGPTSTSPKTGWAISGVPDGVSGGFTGGGPSSVPMLQIRQPACEALRRRMGRKHNETNDPLSGPSHSSPGRCHRCSRHRAALTGAPPTAMRKGQAEAQSCTSPSAQLASTAPQAL